MHIKIFIENFHIKCLVLKIISLSFVLFQGVVDQCRFQLLLSTSIDFLFKFLTNVDIFKYMFHGTNRHYTKIDENSRSRA